MIVLDSIDGFPFVLRAKYMETIISDEVIYNELITSIVEYVAAQDEDTWTGDYQIF